jgi:hypothetical protein
LGNGCKATQNYVTQAFGWFSIYIFSTSHLASNFKNSLFIPNLVKKIVSFCFQFFGGFWMLRNISRFSERCEPKNQKALDGKKKIVQGATDDRHRLTRFFHDRTIILQHSTSTFWTCFSYWRNQPPPASFSTWATLTFLFCTLARWSFFILRQTPTEHLEMLPFISYNNLLVVTVEG